MKYLILIFLFVSCEKEFNEERSLRSAGGRLSITIAYEKTPSHEQAMRELIPKQIEENKYYDSLYVTCIPFRHEIDSTYTVTGRVVYFYHFFGLKKHLGGETFVIYDPSGEMKNKYVDLANSYQ